ncbi:MAG: response regulator [bacterium]|nr:response regulator [bacterium]
MKKNQKNYYFNIKSILTFLIFILLFFTGIPGKAKLKNPLILTQKKTSYILGLHLEILEDPGRKLTINDVSSPEYDKKFIQSEKKIPNYGFTDSAIWARFRVKNENAETGKWMLDVGYPYIHYVDIYIPSPDGQGFTARKTGLLKPVETRDIPYHRIIFNLSIPEGSEQIIYLCFKNEDSITLQLTLRSPEAFYTISRTEFLWIGVYFGILLIMLCYNLFLFFTIKAMDYLYYVLFILTLVFYEFSFLGIGQQYIWPNRLEFNNLSLMLFYGLSSISMIKFSAVFLMTKILTPVLNKILNGMIAAGVVLIIVNLVAGHGFVVPLLDTVTAFSLIVIAITALITWYRGYRHARLFILSWILFITGVIINILVRSDYIPSNTFTEHIYQIGILLLVLVWSLALADRIGQLKLEAEKANRELQKERDLNKELFQKNPALIVAIDTSGSVLMMNDTMCNKLGYSFNEVHKKNYLRTFVPEKEREQVAEIFNVLIKPKEMTVSEYGIQAKDDTRFLIEWHGSRIYNEKGELDFFFGMGIDITDREKIEEQLRQSQKMDTVGTLAGGIAHDFNNILGGIMGTVSLIMLKLRKKKTIENEKLEEYMELIGNSGERAASMIQQLLSLSRKQELDFSPVDLNNSIKHVMKICRNSFDKSIELNPVCNDNPAITFSDPTQIEQVLLNFCINAAHAMTIMRDEDETWGGKLTLSLENITADKFFCETHPEAKETDYWALSVKDTGIGIDANTIPKIFNPFFTTKDKGEGTGLGLSMVYNIIKQHNGFIDVYSEVGLGSSFIIYLPVFEEDEKISEVETKKEIPHGEGLILIVDDEEIMRYTAREILKECGYNVILAENGMRGVEVFENNYKEIKAVLLDMVMPKMSGKEAYIRMKEIDPDVRVLLASGFKQDERVEAVLDLGVNGFLQKPYTLAKLAEAINSVTANL